MKIEFINTKNDFRNLLKSLYKSVLDIDTHTWGWSVLVSKRLYDTHIIEFTNGYGEGYATKTEKERNEKEITSTSKRLMAHISEEKFKEPYSIDATYILIYSRLFGVSTDYLLGVSDTPQPSTKTLPLSLKALNQLTTIKMGEDLKSVLATNDTVTVKPRLIPCLETLIGCKSFSAFLYAFMEYSKPSYTVPVVSDGSDTVTTDNITFADPNNLNDTRNIKVTDDFMKAIYKNRLDIVTNNLSTEYAKKTK